MAPSPTSLDAGSETRTQASRLMASQLGILALCLLSLYVLLVLGAILPPRLLDPAWQVRFTGALINNGFIALLGLALVHLAAYLNPGNPHLGRRRDDFAALALVAVLGFLLLIPLQGYAVWRGINTANERQSSQLRNVTGRLGALRQAINQSTSTQDLQRRLQALQAPPLSPTDLAQPLPQLRRNLLATLEQTQIRADDRLRGLQPEGLWMVVQRSIQMGLAALVLMIGFAAFARRRESEATLLQGWLGRFQGPRNRLGPAPSRRSHRSPREETDDYLRSLVDEDKPSDPPTP